MNAILKCVYPVALAGLIFAASAPSQAQPATTVAVAAPTTPTAAPDNRSMFERVSEEGALLYDGSMMTLIDQTAEGIESFIVRDNVRLITEAMQVRCETLTYDAAKDLMVAKPAYGKRVQVKYGGMRAICGLLEYTPSTEKAILRRRPSIFQKDEKDREMETKGHVITITMSKTKRGSVLIQSKKGDVKSLGPKTPASLIVDTEPTVDAEETVTTIDDMRKGLLNWQKKPLDAGSMAEVPESIRDKGAERP